MLSNKKGKFNKNMFKQEKNAKAYKNNRKVLALV